MQATSKSKSELIVLEGPTDGGSMLASNSSIVASDIGGSFASYHSLSDFFVLACASFAPTTCDGGPMSTLINPETNRPFVARFAMSNTGLVKNDITVAYLQRCVLDVVPDVSPDNPMVGICNVFGDHILVAVIDFCQKHSIMLILWPLHTSHALQPKDIVNFLVFKPAFRKAKQICVTERTLAGMLPDLSWSDLMQFMCDLWKREFLKERNSVDWLHRGLNPFIWCVENRLWREEEVAKLHSATSIFNPLLVICGANHKCAEAAAADPAYNVVAPAGCKVHKGLMSKDLFGLKGGVMGGQATAVIKTKHVCNSKRKAEEQVVQAHTKQQSLDAHAVNIVMAKAIVEALEGEALWTAVLVEKLGMKALAALIVKKGAKPNPKGKKADLVLQVGVLWATK